MSEQTIRRLSDDEITLFKGKNFAHLATIMPDGSPQVTPVWVDYEDGYIIVNTAEGRVKERNMRRDPRVALSILDADDPYESVFFTRGRVVDITPEGGDDSIDALAKRYRGTETYEWRQAGETRLIVKIAPE